MAAMRALLFALILTQATRPVDEFPTNAGPLNVTIIRHASLMIEAGGQVIHVDPSQGNYEGLPQADILLITDTHGDHFVPPLIAKLRKPSTVVVGPEAIAAKVEGVTVMKNGETKTIGKWVFEAVPMYNLKRGPAEGKVFHEKGRGNGYVIAYGGKRFYLAGDTEGIPEMRALRNIDVAFIPMNLPYTMPPDEAAEAVRSFKPKVAYPYHYRGADLSVFVKALASSGVEVRIRDWYYLGVVR